MVGVELREEADDEVEFVGLEEEEKEVVDGLDSGSGTIFEERLEIVAVNIFSRRRRRNG